MANAVAVSGDGSVVLGGSTTNMWGDPLAGSSDFKAYKLDAEGMLLWTWQVESRLSLRPYSKSNAITAGGRSFACVPPLSFASLNGFVSDRDLSPGFVLLSV